MKKRLDSMDRSIRDIIERIYENKYGEKMDDSDFGRFIKYSGNFLLDDEYEKSKRIHYDFMFESPNSILVYFNSYMEKDTITLSKDVFELYYDRKKNDFTDKSENSMLPFHFCGSEAERLEKFLQEKIGVDELCISRYSEEKDGSVTIYLETIGCSIGIDEIASFDPEKCRLSFLDTLKDLNNNYDLEPEQDIT